MISLREESRLKPDSILYLGIDLVCAVRIFNHIGILGYVHAITLLNFTLWRLLFLFFTIEPRLAEPKVLVYWLPVFVKIRVSSARRIQLQNLTTIFV